tara:strand:- start:297 stop:656 length:360 start_codon:yes stop_codon:yes gene_type:complete
MWFGIAHLHHLADKLASGVPIFTALLTLLLQLTYTSIFGYIATYLYLRTGNIFPPIVSHVICNFMGLPDVGFAQNSLNEMRYMYSYRYVLLALHAGGLVAFYFLVGPLTARFADDSPFK